MPDLIDSGVFSAFDRHFARFIGRFGGVDRDALLLAAALLSRATADGNVCLDLKALAGKPLAGPAAALVCPPPEHWLAALRSCPAVGRPGERRPLVLDDAGRLYLHRYWEYESRLAAHLAERAGAPPADIDAGCLKDAIRRRFGDGGGPEVDWQRVAVAVAVLKRLAVITGGPGTGKTTTVARILAVWEAIQAGRPTRVLLAAPTGKAAARLKDSLQPGPAPAYDVTTVHRLLRPVAGTPLFRYNAENPLPVDLMIVDEVSMVDLALMAKLVDALPPAARLVLIGDRDQLASVEAGSVLSDIGGRTHRPAFSTEFGHLIRGVTGQAVPVGSKGRPLQDCIVELQASHRFAADSAIGALSRAVKRGDAPEAMAILGQAGNGSVVWQEPQAGPGAGDLERHVAAGYAAYRAGGDASVLLQELGRFKTLCALRAGAGGVEAVNRLAERILMREGRVRITPRSGSPWYSGRPVLITQNDYSLGLFNGDIGVAAHDSGSLSEGLAVFFTDPSGGLRRFLPYRLPEHETVYAMTVHKSQGSEFEDVLLVLPGEDSPVLSRELVYTALTRARKRVTLFASRDVLATAIRRRIERTSGLRDALWGTSGPEP
jgi:exodeoxyribonuclease V alpha subunit